MALPWRLIAAADKRPEAQDCLGKSVSFAAAAGRLPDYWASIPELLAVAPSARNSAREVAQNKPQQMKRFNDLKRRERGLSEAEFYALISELHNGR
jgi:hypothetical protein